MKRKNINKIISLFIAPIAITHELLHIIAAFIVFQPYTNIKVKFIDGLISIALITSKPTGNIMRWKRIIIAYAPIMLPMAIFILSFIYSFFLYILLYFTIISLALFFNNGYKIPYIFISKNDIYFARKNAITNNEINEYIDISHEKNLQNNFEKLSDNEIRNFIHKYRQEKEVIKKIKKK